MRLLKAQNTNLRSINGKGIKYDINDQIIIDSTNVMLVPKGTTAESPASPINGHVRYNTTTDQLETYQNSAWRNVKFKEPNQDPGIVVQNLGSGDATEIVFGELNSGDINFPVPAAAQNILVFVENVFQIPVTNYNIRQTAQVNTTGPNAPYAETDTGWWIEFTSEVPLGKPVTVIHNFDK